MKNDLPSACDFQISLTINCESTWPGFDLAASCNCVACQQHLIEYDGPLIYWFADYISYDMSTTHDPI